MEIQHYIHDHPLTQYDLDKETLLCHKCNTPFQLPEYYCPECKYWLNAYCPGCGKNIRGKTCACRECYFFIHRSCADKWKQQMEHPFHPLHPLNLYYSSDEMEYIREYTCSACQRITTCFVYHCPECSFGLCLECVSMDPTIKMEDGNHILHLYKNTTFLRRCSVCNEKDRNTFFFICVVPKCGYAVHLHCTPLSFPKTVERLYHHHELVLTKSKVEGDEREDSSESDVNDSQFDEDQYYCDACELKRTPKNPVYYCDKCEFSAHVGCGIKEMLPSLVAEYESHLRSKGDISDPYLENIDTELAELREKLEEVRAKLEALSPKLTELEDERSQYMASAMPSMEIPLSA